MPGDTSIVNQVVSVIPVVHALLHAYGASCDSAALCTTEKLVSINDTAAKLGSKGGGIAYKTGTIIGAHISIPQSDLAGPSIRQAPCTGQQAVQLAWIGNIPSRHADGLHSASLPSVRDAPRTIQDDCKVR